MSRLTCLKCHVYRCPPGQREAARAALEEWGPWGENPGDPESPVDGQTGLAEATCGTVPYLAVALRRAAPGASWVAWERPGRIIAFTPALGPHEGECDGSGEFRIGSSGWEDLRARHSGEALIQALDAALGGPWARDYAARIPGSPRKARNGARRARLPAGRGGRVVTLEAPGGVRRSFAVAGEDTLTVLVDGHPVLGVDRHGPGFWVGEEEWHRIPPRPGPAAGPELA